MYERYELFRFALLPRQQRDVFEGPDPTREEYLRTVFSERLKFQHRGSEYHYVPALEESGAEALLGRIGRSFRSEENHSPEGDLIDLVRDAWKAVVLVVDPREHSDGQKAAVELDPRVGKPRALIASLVEAINAEHPRTAYDIEVSAITSAADFWDFAHENEGEITSLTFDFVAPNMFGGTDNITEELRRFRQVENAQRVEVTLKSKEGLDLETDRVRESVDYTVKGQGRIRAKTKKGRTYNSAKQIETATVYTPEQPGETALTRAARLVSRIFGRE